MRFDIPRAGPTSQQTGGSRDPHPISYILFLLLLCSLSLLERIVLCRCLLWICWLVSDRSVEFLLAHETLGGCLSATLLLLCCLGLLERVVVVCGLWWCHLGIFR